jgi:hypothetical protein
MSFSSSPSKTRDHLPPPRHREVPSQPSPAAAAAGFLSMSPMGDKPAWRREHAQARSTGTSVSGLLTSKSAIR